MPNAVSAGGVRWGEGGGASVEATPAVAAAKSANSLRIRPATEPRIVKSVATTEPSFKKVEACNANPRVTVPQPKSVHETTVRRGPHRA